MESTLRDFFFGPGPIVWFQEVLEPVGPVPFRALSLLGDIWGLLLVLGLAFWFWGPDTLYVLLPLVVIEGVSYLGLNGIFPIPRPSADSVTQYETLSISAFPSGHTYLTTILWGFLYQRDRIPLAAAAAAVLGVAVGRFFLGVHNLGDIVGGVVLGAAVVALYSAVSPALMAQLRRASWRGYLVAGAALTIAWPLVFSVPSENPRRVAVMAIVAILLLALPLEKAFIRFRGCRRDVPARAACFATGFFGLALCYAAEQLLPGSNTLTAVAAATATLWVVVATPILARWSGLERWSS
ncbi:MAG: phosphatase PAP2 family protein [Gemmatimonadota bacterium]